jgi:hypothetical protein
MGGVDVVCDVERPTAIPPGPELAAILADQDRLCELDDAELIEMMAAARRQTAWAQARELAMIAELTARRAIEDERPTGPRVLSAGESLIEEIATALTVTGNAAATLMHTARRLAHALPGTRTALEEGRIDLLKARVICDATEGMPGHTTRRMESTLLANASERTTGQLRRRAKALARRLAPELCEELAERTTRNRRVEVWDNATGTAALAVLDISGDDAHAIHNKITAAARAIRVEGDPRGLDRLRADLATLLLRGHPLPDAVAALAATAPSRAPSSTAPSGARPGSDRSWSGVGGGPDRPSDAEDARRIGAWNQGTPGSGVLATLANDAEWRLTEVRARLRGAGRLDELPEFASQAVRELHRSLVPYRDSWCDTDERGRHGHPGHRPPAALRRMIAARHPTCVFPTCNRRVEHCDLDHTIAYDAHGPTCGCNLAPLCRRHHRTKQTPGWRLFQPWPGLLIWITPSGTWHIVRPE